MRTDVCFDTNVLLYLADEGAKAQKTEELLRDGGVVNALVLTEAAHVIRRKWKRTWEQTNGLLAAYKANLLILPLSEDAVLIGMRYGERYKLQAFDAVIIAAAVLAGCHTLWTEDMHNGLIIDGLTIRNPYKP
jgi:predicted nucleic acid-binding protein